MRATEQFRLAEAEGKLLRLPTGDGGAFVFRKNPEAPVLCAMEICEGTERIIPNSACAWEFTAVRSTKLLT